MKKELLGKMLGVLLLIVLFPLVPYLTIGWILWDLDPSNWPSYARAIHTIVTFGAAGWWLWEALRGQ